MQAQFNITINEIKDLVSDLWKSICCNYLKEIRRISKRLVDIVSVSTKNNY